MPEYRVKWEIDLDANSPEDAARRALQIQRDRQSITTVFEVREWKTFNRGGSPAGDPVMGRRRPAAIDVSRTRARK